ncbi:diacylglycerol kinase 3-like [Zingiber officinale]|uniref:diacylglycerol kinase 3-like n=1 Tax=Zingiber officinale TaxID=94328 RepID=UPI001C4D6CA9|nr:diacylglycerol kinase 3-like [Zingiber officinale]
MSNSKAAVEAAGGANVKARSSLWDSIRACGIFGAKVQKEELRRRIVMPAYLRSAVAESIRVRDVGAGVSAAAEKRSGTEADEMPEAPLVVFVNSRSGGRHGPELLIRLQDLISDEQVFDLSATPPTHFVRYGLTCLENLASLGDDCAKAIRAKLRIMVAGGDGTVGWILGSLGELFVQNREPVPPTGIIPLGTGNDLSRSFGWGGSFPFAWRSAVKQSLFKAVSNPVRNLDSWHVTIIMQETQGIQLPYCLKPLVEYDLNQDVDIQRGLPEKVSCFEGVFYNYLSIGMDAKVAYGFHHLRDTKPYLAQGPISNKLIYAGYSCTQGWFLTPCVRTPNLRGLKNILSLHVKKVNSKEWEKIPIPTSVRSLVLLNLDSYGSGRHPWGHPSPKYLDQRRFYEARADDGLLEIFGLKQGWHASMVMVEIISAVHIAQAAAVKLELRGGDWSRAYLQTDGEPWKHPLNREHSTFLTVERVPFQSQMISGK